MKVASILISIFLPFSIFLTNFLALSFSDTIYKSFYKNSEELHYALKAVDHIRLGRELNSDFFSQQAIVHMADVKKLYDLAIRANAVIVLILFGSIFNLIAKKNYRDLKEGIISGLIIATLVILLVFISTLVSFNESFIVFHKLVFTNNLWLFPPGDNLVKLFSIDFFTYFLEKLTINILITILFILISIKLIPKNAAKNS